MSVLHRNVKRRVAEIILSVGIRPVLDEDADAVAGVGVSNRGVERRGTARLAEVDVRTTLDQSLQNGERDTFDDREQRGAALGIGRIRICGAAR